MIDKLRTTIIVLLALFLFTPVIFCQFSYLETENLKLVYLKATHSYLVPYIAQCFENSLKFHRQLWDYTPSEKTTVTLFDIGDYGNAGATAIPENRISVMIAPMSYAYETSPANERMNTIFNHEMVHIVALDKAAGTDKFFRSLFWGKVDETSDNPLSVLYSYLTNPRRSAPRWYHEGIAVFIETWMAGGLGRAQGAYDEMVFRTMVLDSSRIYDLVGLESEGTKIDFQVVTNSYLYGTRFLSYLAYQYGPESLIEWVSRTNGSKSYFATQFKKIYGISIDNAWSHWIEWEHQFQQTNLDSIRLYPTTSFRNISRKALGAVSRAFYNSNDRKLYAAVDYPGQVAHIAAINIDNGKIKKICDVKGSALYFVSSLAYNPTSGTLFYTTDNNDWRDLKVIDIKSGKSKMLIKDARVGDLTFNRADTSIWGVRHFNGISTLVRIPYPYYEWNQIYSWPYGKDMYDIDISPDGKRLSAALAEINGRQTLITMDIDKLMNGDTSYITLYDFMYSLPANFIFSADGKYLYGSSYYSGVSNIFRYDLEADSMDAISNCETGFFRPIPISDDSLIVFRYSGKGFVPVMISNEPLEDVSAIVYLGQKIVEKHPVVIDWMADSPASINIDSLIIDSGDYRGLQNLRLTSAYPIVEGFKDFPAYGMRVNFAEPIGFYHSDLTASYTPNSNLPEDERWHVKWNLGKLSWNVMFKYNSADFYDLFGPTKTSRKGLSLGIKYQKTLLFDLPKSLDFSIRVTGYSNLEKLPDFQNITTSFDKFLTVNSVLYYKNLRHSLGAIDYEKGFKWQLISSNTYVNRKLFPHILSNIDFGIALPIHHSSIWLRSSSGYSPGERREPFANFFFGGFGNNWVDYLSEKRYRHFYSFPGVELNSIGGTNYSKLVVEWNLPPLRFRRLGIPSLYCTWARVALFTVGIVTNIEEAAVQRTLLSVGSQIDFRMQMLSHLNLTFSLGYAAAFEKDQSISKEFMFSLKVL